MPNKGDKVEVKNIGGGDADWTLATVVGKGHGDGILAVEIDDPGHELYATSEGKRRRLIVDPDHWRETSIQPGKDLSKK